MGQLNPCGSSCEGCPNHTGARQPACAGCTKTSGHPFWGECKPYSCAISHKADHCGVCGEFPCDLLVGHFDPANPEGQRNAVYRVGVLAYRGRHGEEKALDLIRKTARS